MPAHTFPLPSRPDWGEVRAAAVHSFALGVAVFISYWLMTALFARVRFLSTADELLGGMWAAVATVFVYHTSYQGSVRAAVSRIAATLLSLALCLAYLVLFAFHPLGMAALIGLGTLVLTLVRHGDDVVTTGITTAVVMVVAALSPHDAWEQPILRLIDTCVGVAVGFGAAWMAQRLRAVVPRVPCGSATSTMPPVAGQDISPTT